MLRRGIHRHARVVALGVDDVEAEPEVGKSPAVEQPFFYRGFLNAPKRFQTGVLGVLAPSHRLDDEK